MAYKDEYEVARLLLLDEFVLLDDLFADLTIVIGHVVLASSSSTTS